MVAGPDYAGQEITRPRNEKPRPGNSPGRGFFYGNNLENYTLAVAYFVPAHRLENCDSRAVAANSVYI